MNVDQKVATLEALLVRVKRNAAEARPARALHVVANDEAAHGSSIEDATTELPPELAHAVLPAPASSRTPAVAAQAASPKPPPVVESMPPSIEPEPESKPRLVALAPPLATASRAPTRTVTPSYGVPAQREAAKPAPSPKPAPVQESPKPAATRPITPQAPPVVAKPPTPAVTAKPAPSRVQPAPRTAAPVAKADAPVTRAREAASAAPTHERSGAKTLMGTGLDEMRKALAQLDSKAPAPPTSPSAQPALLGAEKISDDTTGEGATLVRSSPFGDRATERSRSVDTSVAAHTALAKQSLVEEASTEDEQTVLIPQPTQEELIAASERAGGRITRKQVREDIAKALEDESGEGDTLVKESPFAAADAARGTLPMGEPEPPTLAKPQVSPGPKVGAMGTMMMPTSPSASAMASPPAPPPPEMPKATPHGTAIIEPALAATIASQAAPEMAAPMPGPMAVPAAATPQISPPENARPVGPSGPQAPSAQPSFLRDGPAYEAPLPIKKKKSRAPMLGVGIAAAALVAAGAWLSLRNGWIDELIGATNGKATPTASAKPSSAPSAATSAAQPATAAPPASAAPTASAAPAASAKAAASATPSATPSAKPAAGDASALPKGKGILMVTPSQPGVVYVNGKFIGNAGEPLTVDCGIKYIRLAEPGAAPGKPPTFVGHGRPLKIGCQKTTEVVLPAPPGLDGPSHANEDTPAPGGNPAPDL